MTLHCQNCKAKLTEALWRDQGEYFIPCFGCGVRNIVLPMLQIVGWRTDTLVDQRGPAANKRSPSFSREAAPASRSSQLIAGSRLD